MPTLRSAAIRLADRTSNRALRALLLRELTAKEHATEDARKKYLNEHPKADPRNHTVSKGKGKKQDESGGTVAKARNYMNSIRSKAVTSHVESFLSDADRKLFYNKVQPVMKESYSGSWEDHLKAAVKEGDLTDKDAKWYRNQVGKALDSALKELREFEQSGEKTSDLSNLAYSIHHYTKG